MAEDAAVNNTNKKAIFKNFAPFTNCIRNINNTEIDNAKYIDIAMLMYVIIILKYLEAYGNIVKKYQL